MPLSFIKLSARALIRALKMELTGLPLKYWVTEFFIAMSEAPCRWVFRFPTTGGSVGMGIPPLRGKIPTATHPPAILVGTDGYTLE